MTYDQYRLIYDLIEKEKKKLAAEIIAAGHLWSELHRAQKALKECAQSWVKENHPDDKDLWHFWGIEEEKPTNSEKTT